MRSTTASPSAGRPAVCRLTPVLACGLVLAGWSAATPVRADAIDRQLVKEAPRVVKYLQAHHYRTVGVLKFRVHVAGRPASFNAGPINGSMADRLESALILANDPAHPIGIIENAGRQAFDKARSARRGLRFVASLEGRRSLLGSTYALAWGNQKVRPDAFLTGDIALSKDNRHAMIRIKLFDQKSPKTMKTIHEFRIKTDRMFLAECGQNFVVPRRLARDPDEADDKAADNATKQEDKSTKPVTKDPENPIQLRILYSGNEMTFSDTVPDPKETDEVKFVIKNKGSERVAVVLAVNNKSTLAMEDVKEKQPSECTKWILDPGDEYVIPGFYMDDKGENMKKFRVLSDPESDKLMEVDPDTNGVISMWVFRKAGAGDKSLKAEDRNLRRGAVRTRTKARSLKDAQAARATARGHSPSKLAKRSGKRGIIVEEEKLTAGGPLQRVKFEYDPQPFVELKIRYYSKKGS